MSLIEELLWIPTVLTIVAVYLAISRVKGQRHTMSILSFTIITSRLSSCYAQTNITYVNPGNFSNITCGINDNCIIRCTEYLSCAWSIFYVYNNNITIECSGDYSCYSTEIFSSNVHILQLKYIGVESFSWGLLRVNSTNIKELVIVECLGAISCILGEFLYDESTHVVHICDASLTDGSAACTGAIIKASRNMRLYCNSLYVSQSCKHLNLIIPVNIMLDDKFEINMTVLDDSYDVTHWVIYDIFYTNLTKRIHYDCPYSHSSTLCEHISFPYYLAATIYYGYEFDITCHVKNVSCINSVISYEESPTDVAIKWYVRQDNLILNEMNIQTNLIIFLDDPRSKTFVSPQMNDSITLSLVIIGNWNQFDSIFDLSNTQNVILNYIKYGFLQNNYIIGPQQYFKLNKYHFQYTINWWPSWPQGIWYDLRNTTHIVMNMDENNSVVVVGQNTEVKILTQNDRVSIYSSADLSIPNAFAESGGYNIQCTGEYTFYDPCFNLYIKFFTSLYHCQWSWYDDKLCDYHPFLERANYTKLIKTTYLLEEFFVTFFYDYDEYIDFQKTANSQGWIINYRASFYRITLLLELAYIHVSDDLLSYRDFEIIIDDYEYNEVEEIFTIETIINYDKDSIGNEIKKINDLTSMQYLDFADYATYLLRMDVENYRLLLSIPEDNFVEDTTAEQILMIIVPCFVGIIMLIFMYYSIKSLYRRYHQKWIQNPLIVLIAIGDYEVNPKDPGIDCVVDDINVDVDINNLFQLFKDTFNYNCIMGSVAKQKNDQNIKIDWTQNEIETLLEASAKEFVSNYSSYDSLILITSCHGIKNNIITSDYQLIDKDYMHRFYSVNYKKLRKKPRIFIFDCCDGDEKRELKNIPKGNNDLGKNIQLKDLKVSDVWLNDDENPDHQLVLIHAANTGFQSRMDMEDGSYLLTEFKNRTINNMKNENNCFRKHKNIGELFNDIQNSLHKKGQQQTVNIFNNKTHYLKFRKYNGNKIEFTSQFNQNETKSSDPDTKDNDKNMAIELTSINKEPDQKGIIVNNKTVFFNKKTDNSMDIRLELATKIRILYKSNPDQQYIKNEMMKHGYNVKQINSCFLFLGIIQDDDDESSEMNDSRSIDIEGLNDIIDDLF